MYASLTAPVFRGELPIRLVNVANEQMKFHGLGNNDGPSGVLVHHNTFVSPNEALGDFTTAANNLPASVPTNIPGAPVIPIVPR